MRARRPRTSEGYCLDTAKSLELARHPIEEVILLGCRIKVGVRHGRDPSQEPPTAEENELTASDGPDDTAAMF
jgi:hypothetical protein